MRRLLTSSTKRFAESFPVLKRVLNKSLDASGGSNTIAECGFRIADLKKSRRTSTQTLGRIGFEAATNSEKQMKNFRALTAGLFILGVVTSACNSGTSTQSDDVQRELLTLEVAPGEVVMADRPAPVDTESPCSVPVFQGIGRFADVGWVAPRFFQAAITTGGPGYEIKTLRSDRSRFKVRFRVPRSEREAIALYGAREWDSQNSNNLFCNVAGTLKRLSGSGIRRLASWPVASVKAFLNLEGKRRELALDLSPNWAAGGDLLATVELSNSERARLEQELKSSFGASVFFDVSTRWRRTGCLQLIQLNDNNAIEAFGLHDGERGAVSLGLLRLAVSKLASQETNVSITGDCGSQSVLLPPGASGGETNASCIRSGYSLDCRLEGQFSEMAFIYSTETNIGEHIAGVF